MRRQPVALGAGGRARPVAVEGPRPARDARPHALPADRRPALPAHAARRTASSGSSSRGARQIERGRAAGRAGIRDAGRAATAGPRCRRAATAAIVRARRAAGLPGRARRWFAEQGHAIDQPRRSSARSRSCDIGDNRPWLAFIEADASAARPRATCCRCTIEWARFDRERYNPHALAAVRRGAREGTLLDVAAEPDLHRAAARAICTRPRPSTNATGAARVPADRRVLATQPVPRSPRRPRGRDRAVEHARRWSTTDYVVKIYRRLRAGHQSGNRDRPLPDRRRRLRQHARRCSAASNWSRATSAARSRSSTRFVENQGDAWTVTQRLSRPLRRRAAPAARPSMPGDSDEQAAYLQRMAQIGRRTAELHLALASQRRHRRFRAGADHAGRRRALDRRGPATRAERVFDELGRGADRLTEADRPLVDSCSRSARRCRTDSAALLPPTSTAMQDPPPRRLPSRPDADRQGRRLHHRFRRRAAAHARGAPAQGARGARRRRPDPLDRLFGDRRAASARSKSAPDEHGKLARALADWRDRGRGAFLAAYRETLTDRAAVARRSGSLPTACSISSCWRRRSTRSSTNWRIGRTGCTCR